MKPTINWGLVLKMKTLLKKLIKVENNEFTVEEMQRFN